jgi:carboxymethylenebutenolidase
MLRFTVALREQGAESAVIRALRTAVNIVLHSAVAFAVIGLMFATAQAQSGSRIHMHGKGDYAADGTLYVPTGQGPFAAVMLIPDERGLTRRVTDSAVSFVQAGYIVVAVDLNRGLAEGAVKRSDEQIRLDLDAALAFLAGQSNVRQGSIGAMGWGSGGISALRLAANGKIAAVAIESLPPAQSLPNLDPISAPVLGIFTAHDATTTLQSVKAFERRLRALSKSVSIKVYSGPDSGFDDPEDTIHYSPAEAADARQVSLDFFLRSFMRT